MGREWYFNWGTKSSSKKKGVAGGGGGKGGERKAAAPPAAMAAAAAAAAATTGGCMNAVLHMFDFHQFQLCLYPHDNAAVADQILSNNVSKHHDPISTKANSGVEAPRNSLESLDDMVHNEPPSLASIMKEENIDTSHILASRRDTKLKLVQAPRNKLEELSSSESNSSPAAARTPTLVARLMGLDILPESTNTTPRSSTCQKPIRSPHVSSTPPTRKIKTRISNSTGSHSLPETPRSSSSSARRKSTTNFIDQHRLSLQINKENSIVKEMESSRPSCSAISTKKKIFGGSNYEEECKSPGYYARQIMRQVKETVSRRVGVDITNTVDQRDKDIRRDEHLLSSNKIKKSNGNNSSKSTNKTKMMSSYEFEQVISKNVDVGLVEGKLQLKDEKIKNDLEEKKEDLDKKLLVSGSNKMSVKKVPLKSLDWIKNKKDDQFVRSSIMMRVNNDGSSSKKCKRMPLSSDLFQGSVPSFVTFKKDSTCPSLTKLLDKKGVLSKAKPLKEQTSINVSTNTNTNTNTMARLSKIPRQQYIQEEEVMHTPAGQEDRRSNKDTNSILDQFQYISRILKCTGIDRDTPISFTRWFSPTHPLDPSIFHTLEITHYLNLNDPSSPHHQKNTSSSFNRKLIFHLVDEILADLLKPYIENKPWALTSLGQNSHYTHQQQLQLSGFQLVKTLCTRIRSFPSSNCQNLQDIDALVVKNMPKFGFQSDWIAVEEEGDAIVFEIGRDILNSLVQEIANTLTLVNHVRSMQKYFSML